MPCSNLQIRKIRRRASPSVTGTTSLSIFQMMTSMTSSSQDQWKLLLFLILRMNYLALWQSHRLLLLPSNLPLIETNLPSELPTTPFSPSGHAPSTQSRACQRIFSQQVTDDETSDDDLDDNTHDHPHSVHSSTGTSTDNDTDEDDDDADDHPPPPLPQASLLNEYQLYTQSFDETSLLPNRR